MLQQSPLHIFLISLTCSNSLIVPQSYSSVPKSIVIKDGEIVFRHLTIAFALTNRTGLRTTVL